MRFTQSPPNFQGAAGAHCMLPWSWCFPRLRPICPGKTIPGYPVLHRENTHFPGWFSQWHRVPFLKMTRGRVRGLTGQPGSPQTLEKSHSLSFWDALISIVVKNKNLTALISNPQIYQGQMMFSKPGCLLLQSKVCCTWMSGISALGKLLTPYSASWQMRNCGLEEMMFRWTKN